MRLSWLLPLRRQILEAAQFAPRRRRKSAPLRVRRLERRRVLNASVSTIMFSPADSDVGTSVHDSNEGTQLTATSDATGTGTLHFNWTLMQGATTLATSTDPTFTFTPADNGNYDVKLSVTDDNPTAAQISTPILVHNVDPSIDQLKVNSPIPETGVAILKGSYSDPGTLDTHSLDIDWDGDNVYDETITVTNGAFAIGHQYLDDNPTGTPSDTFDIHVRLRDNNGGSDTGQISLTVENLAPELDPLKIVTPVDENGTTTLKGSYFDFGTQDTHELDIDWNGDNVFDQTVAVSGGSFTITHQYLDDAATGTPTDTYTIHVQLRDDDTGSDTAQIDVTVNNVDPKLDSLLVNSPINENGGVILKGTYSDVGTLDTHEVDIDWDGNGTFDQTVAVSGGSFSINHQYLDDNPTATPSDTFTIHVRLRDDDTGFATGQVDLTVKNGDPSIDSLSINSPINENDVAKLKGTYSDVGTQDTHLLDIDWNGDNVFDQTVAVTGGSFSVDHQYLDDNPTGTLSDTFTIHVRLRDDDTGFDTDQIDLTVNDVNPTIDELKITSPISEHDFATLKGSYSDVGSLDTHFLDIDWNGDNVIDQTVAVSGGSFTINHQYLDDDPTGTPSDTFSIHVRLRDDDTGFDTGQIDITVNNLDPSIDSLSINSPINENGVATLTGTYSDVGTLDTHFLDIDWNGDNVFDQTVAVSGGSFSVNHPYLDDNPTNTPSDTFAVHVRLRDDDTGFDTDQVNLTVNNLDPSIDSISVNSPINENGVATLTGTYSDVGTLDTHFLDIDWDGDNVVDQTVAVSGGTFSVSHQFLDDNPTGTPSDTFAIHVRLRDDDTGFDDDQVSLTVKNVDPSIGTLTISSPINENDFATLQGTYGDIGTQDTHFLDIDWDGNGTFDQTVAVSGGTFSVSHQYLDDNPTATSMDTFTVHVRLRDDDTGFDTDQVDLTVKNVDPSIDELKIVSPINENDFTTLKGSYSDIGSQDTHLLDIDWDGNGTFDQTVAVTGAAFSVDHQYLDDNPTATPSDTFTIHVQLRDDDTGFDTGQIDITVNNLNPTIDELKIVSPINENDFTTLKGSYSDVGTLDTHELDIDWDGNGTFDQTVAVSGGTFSINHQYLDDNPTATPSDTFTVHVRLRDDDTGFDTGQIDITVNNLDPSIDSIAITSPINENGAATLTGTYSDVGTLDTHVLDIDWDGNGTFDQTVAVSGGTFSVSHQYLDDNPTATSSDTFTVHVRLRDDDTGFDTDQVDLTVNNLDPSIDSIAITSPINENDVATLTGTYSDVGTLDTHVLDIDWDGNGTFDQTVAVSGGSFSVTHQYLDDNPTGTPSDTFNVHVRLRDDDTGFDTDQVSLTVNNLDPSIDSIAMTSPINENDVATLTGTYSDVGTLDTHVLDIDWDGNGTFDETVAVSGGSFSVNHQFLDDNPTGTPMDTFTVHVRLRDDDTGFDTDQIDLTVKNLDPSIDELKIVSPIDENDFTTLKGSYSDVGTLDTHMLDIDWDGDNVFDETVVVSGGSFSINHTYLDDNPTATPSDTFTVHVRLRDDDTGFDTGQIDITVNNVDPVVTPFAGTTINEGDLLDLTGVGSAPFLGTFTDVGTQDTHTATVDWGDGHSSPVTLVEVGGSGTLAASHTYADDGTYTVKVTVTDDDTGTHTAMFTVNVNNVVPKVEVGGPFTVDEGTLLDLPALATFKDPGFDNAQNPTTPATGDPLAESFRYFLDWGDGREQIGTAPIADTNGMPGTPSSGTISGSHTYADDGTYTVTVRVADDNMTGNFTTGVNGIDYVEKTFTVTVNNVVPMVSVGSNLTVDEGTLVNLPSLATFTDQGFDNPLNLTTPATGDPLAESFRYFLDWGDGRQQIATAPIADTNGAPGTPSSGTISGSHTYADDGTYTVTVRVADDNMTGNFTSGVNGIDYVEKTFTITVHNVVPTVSVGGPQTINEGALLHLPSLATFTDPGFDNPANPTTPATGNPLAESFRYFLDWGDGRQQVATANITDTNGSPGTPSSGTTSGDHFYADNGTYTITVRVADDNMTGNFTGGVNGVDYVEKTITVTVNNVDPILTGTANRNVDEGTAFTLQGLGVALSDPGFDNPLNPVPGGETQETFTFVSVDWGDGTAIDASSTSIVNRVSGTDNVLTTAQFSHDPHTYADDGVYTVTIMMHDDDGPTVARQFTITVHNVRPALVVVGNQSLDESGTLVLSNLGTLTDPGFDNPLNPATNGGPSKETFTYFIDWDDGTTASSGPATVDLVGSPGVKTAGSFDGSHTFADNGVYTVHVRIADDNMTANFTSGVKDVDFVELTFQVTVNNLPPAFVPINGQSFQGDDLNVDGLTTIRLGVTDKGFDNPLNTLDATNGGEVAETFTHIVDWGDGTIDAVHTFATNGVFTVTVKVTDSSNVTQTYTFTGVSSAINPVLTLVSSQPINDAGVPMETFTYEVNWGDSAVNTMTLSLKATAGVPLMSTGQTNVVSSLRTSGSLGVQTTGSAEVQHTYLGPPDPLHPTADITINLTVMDDDQGITSDSVTVSNPGIHSNIAAIDTTPDVARLDFTQVVVAELRQEQIGAGGQVLQQADIRAGSGDMAATADRYLELHAVYPDGTEGPGYRIKDEALNDLRAFFKTLPDGRYRIYLRRTENNSKRLVIEVDVRRGRVIDTSDDSEGTRDRPPTGEQSNQTQPLNDNPLLEAVPNSTSSDASTAPTNEQAANVPAVEPATDAAQDNAVETAPVSTRASRLAVPLAGLGLVTAARPWSERVDDALAEAEDHDWRRLRRAGRTSRLLKANPRLTLPSSRLREYNKP